MQRSGWDCRACRDAHLGLRITSDGDLTLDERILAQPPPPGSPPAALAQDGAPLDLCLPMGWFDGPFAAFAAARACLERREKLVSADNQLFTGGKAMCGAGWCRAGALGL